MATKMQTPPAEGEVTERGQYVTGVIGSAVDLKMALQRAIKEKGFNWDQLGKKMMVSRQALCSSVEQENVKFTNLRRICDEIGADPFDFFEPVPPERNKEIL